jgi:hypothetical protein
MSGRAGHAPSFLPVTISRRARVFEQQRGDIARQFSQQDLLAVGIKGFCGLLGPLGGVVGEFVTQFVPEQRLDRLANMVEQLDEQLGGLREEFKARLHQPTFAALTEDAFVSAVQTPSDARRRQLASLLRNGLADADAELGRKHTLLRILGGLEDAGLIILRAYGFSRPSEGAECDAYIQRHASVLDVIPLHGAQTDEERRRWAFYRFYEDRLVSSGLLRELEGTTVRTSPRPLRELTDLGRLLLSAIEPSVVDPRQD